MKRLLFPLFILLFFEGKSQSILPTYSGEADRSGFRKENIFIGGGLNIGFAANTFGVGINPEIGYSISKWLDAGLALNINYASQRADPYYNGNIRQRNFSYGAGPFVRVYPIPFIFVTAQLEKNWSKVNLKDYYSGQIYNYNYDATSLIAGIAYSQRIIGQSSFYTMIGIDLLNDPNSPYRDYNNNPYPVIKAGFDFYLRPSRKR